MNDSNSMCKIHNSTLVYFCLKSDCTNQLTCCKCIISHVQKCGENLVFFEDIATENMPMIFRTSILKDSLNKNQIENLSPPLSKQQLQNIVSNAIADFLDFVKIRLSKIEQDAFDQFEIVRLPEENMETIKEIIEFDQLNQMGLSSWATESNLSELPLIRNQKKIVNSLNKFKEELNEAFASQNKIEEVMQHLDTLRNCFEMKETRKPKLAEKTLEENSIMKEVLAEIELVEQSFKENELIKQYQGESKRLESNKSKILADKKVNIPSKVNNIWSNLTRNNQSKTYFDMVMKPNTGVFKWTLKFSKIGGVGLPKDVRVEFGIQKCDINFNSVMANVVYFRSFNCIC